MLEEELWGAGQSTSRWDLITDTQTPWQGQGSPGTTLSPNFPECGPTEEKGVCLERPED